MEKLQWHPAFFACLQVVFGGEGLELANEQLFKAVWGMCEALHELWKDDLEKAVAIEVAAVMAKKEAEMAEREAAVTENVTRNVTKSVTEKERLNGLRNIMKNLEYTAEQAMTVLGIPKRERKKYMLLLQ